MWKQVILLVEMTKAHFTTCNERDSMTITGKN